MKNENTTILQLLIKNKKTITGSFASGWKDIYYYTWGVLAKKSSDLN